MNINFHYYAIKAIARFAGFEAADAQLIAEYSQFVDDYITSGTITITNPEGAGYAAANALGIVRQDGVKRLIDSIQTGFAGIDYLLSLGSGFQNKTIVPFHFIPSFQLVPQIYHRATVPASLGDGSVISSALNEAMQEYRQHPGENRYLVQLGVLLHIFADTYAHQRFNGHWDGIFQKDMNGYYIYHVWKNTAYGVRGDEVTPEYSPNRYALLPAVGHATAGHAPDDTDISFVLHNNSNYERNNTDTFAEAAREIYRILFWCRTGGYPTNAQCDNLKARLLPGLLVKNGQEPTAEMLHAWAGAFPEFGFAYDKDHVLRRLLPDVTSVEFEDRDGKMRIQNTGDDIYRGFFDTDRQLKAVKSVVSDEFYWFTIAAHLIRSQAVSPNYLT